QRHDLSRVRQVRCSFVELLANGIHHRYQHDKSGDGEDRAQKSAMRITKPTSRALSGNTLLIVLVLMGILTLALGVYLNLTSSENKQTLRSQCWNSALPWAEAGIEEAMSQIAMNTNNFALDGWTKVGTNNLYLKQRTNGSDFYMVGISGKP